MTIPIPATRFADPAPPTAWHGPPPRSAPRLRRREPRECRRRPYPRQGPDTRGRQRALPDHQAADPGHGPRHRRRRNPPAAYGSRRGRGQRPCGHRNGLPRWKACTKAAYGSPSAINRLLILNAELHPGRGTILLLREAIGLRDGTLTRYLTGRGYLRRETRRAVRRLVRRATLRAPNIAASLVLTTGDATSWQGHRSRPKGP